MIKYHSGHNFELLEFFRLTPSHLIGGAAGFCFPRYDEEILKLHNADTLRKNYKLFHLRFLPPDDVKNSSTCVESRLGEASRRNFF